MISTCMLHILVNNNVLANKCHLTQGLLCGRNTIILFMHSSCSTMVMMNQICINVSLDVPSSLLTNFWQFGMVLWQHCQE